MGLKILFFVSAFLLLIPVALAQELTLEVNGSCIDYNVKLIAEDFEKGCYDVKIDVKTPEGRVGEIYDPNEGWKSSYYYIKDGFCNQESYYKNFELKVGTKKDFSFVASLKSSSRVWTSDYYEVKQNCPKESLEPENFFLAVLIVVLILLAGITFYVKKFK